MATVKFVLKGKKNPSSIYVRLRDGRNIDIILSTNITINPMNWSDSKGWVKQIASFKEKQNFDNRLRKLETLIYDERNKRVDIGLPITKDWLKNLVDREQGKQTEGDKELLITHLINYKDGLPNRVRNGKRGVSEGTIRNYNTTISRLKRFELDSKRKFRLIEVDLTFHDRYMKFAIKEMGLSLNSVGKDIQQIKTVCIDAKESGERINEQVLSKKFNKPSEPTIFTTLNEQELNLLFEYEGKNYLENARDWLLIGSWTGCRVGDLMKLNDKNIITHTSGKKIVQYTQSKTGRQVNVPMHPHVEMIVERLKGFPRPLSSVNFNKYIKEVCKIVGMTYKVEGAKQNPFTHLKEVGSFEKWELIKSHTCRRSFATNHYNKLPNKRIMAVTGHATEKMLLNYIGEVEDDHVDDFFELWEEQSNNSDKEIIKVI